MERPAHPLLRPFVRSVWHGGSTARGGLQAENMAPSAEMHIAFRLHGPVIRLIETGGAAAYGHAVACGMRTSYFSPTCASRRWTRFAIHRYARSTMPSPTPPARSTSASARASRAVSRAQAPCSSTYRRRSLPSAS